MATDWNSGQAGEEEVNLHDELTAAEQALVERELGWCKGWEVIRTAGVRKLVRLTTPQNEKQYYTLIGEPKSRLLFHEPVYFDVTVEQAKGQNCRAGHKVGDCWQFDWCTPAGLCGAAYHAMYPVVHGLMLTSGRYEGPADEKTRVTCPDDGWLTFRIERRRWTPEMWEDALTQEESL